MEQGILQQRREALLCPEEAEHMRGDGQEVQEGEKPKGDTTGRRTDQRRGECETFAK